METNTYHERFFTKYKIFWFLVYFLLLCGGFFLAEVSSHLVYGKSLIRAVADSGLARATRERN